MRKKLSLLFIYFVITTCSSTKVTEGFKTYTNSQFSFDYPSDWKVYEDHSHLAVSPKKFLRSNLNRYHNIISLIDYSQGTLKNWTIEKIIATEKEMAIQHTVETKFTIENKMSKNEEVIVIIMDKTNSNLPLREVMHIYSHKDSIFALKYAVASNKYDEYIKDAMTIFSSFRFID